MENLNTSAELKQIISLYETESNRKRKPVILNIFSSIIDKIFSLFYPKPVYSPHSYPTQIEPQLTQNFYQTIESIDEELPSVMIEEENDFNLINLESEKINNEALTDEFNLETLQEFFKNNATPESENLFHQLLTENYDSENDTAEVQQPESNFATRSYRQRIEEHAKQENHNEQLWRRRQSILNNR